jgi:hypothetical protein
VERGEGGKEEGGGRERGRERGGRGGGRSGAGPSLLFVVGAHRWCDRWHSSLTRIIGVSRWHASLAFVCVVSSSSCCPRWHASSSHHLPGRVPALLGWWAGHTQFVVGHCRLWALLVCGRGSLSM